MTGPGESPLNEAPAGYAARYADGKTAVVHEVRLHLTGEGIEILDSGGARLALWTHDEVRYVERPVAGRPVRLKSLSQDLARLDVAEHAIVEELRALAPTVGQIGARDPIARKKVAFWIAAMFVLIGGGWFALSHSAPVIAAMMPLSMEERMGRTAIQQVTLLFGGFRSTAELTCQGEAGQRALDSLVARLKAVDDSEYRFRVTVLDIDIPNAFAAPGGYVVVFNGLLEMAETPDQLAGVLAHEMTHVTNRHATANLVRSIGFQSFIVPLLTGGTVTGDVMTGIGEIAVQASYTREAEAEADRGAIELMNRAGLKAASFTDLLLAIEEKYGGESAAEAEDDGEDAEQGGSLFTIPDMLRTHPSTPERARLAREAAAPGGEAGLNEPQWQALKAICD